MARVSDIGGLVRKLIIHEWPLAAWIQSRSSDGGIKCDLVAFNEQVTDEEVKEKCKLLVSGFLLFGEEQTLADLIESARHDMTFRQFFDHCVAIRPPPTPAIPGGRPRVRERKREKRKAQRDDDEDDMADPTGDQPSAPPRRKLHRKAKPTTLLDPCAAPTLASLEPIKPRAAPTPESSVIILVAENQDQTQALRLEDFLCDANCYWWRCTDQTNRFIVLSNSLRAQRSICHFALEKLEGSQVSVVTTTNPLVDEHARECGICSAGRLDAGVTPCGHVFCGQCWEAWAKANKREETFACPMCKAPYLTEMYKSALVFQQ